MTCTAMASDSAPAPFISTRQVALKLVRAAGLEPARLSTQDLNRVRRVFPVVARAVKCRLNWGFAFSNVGG